MIEFSVILLCIDFSVILLCICRDVHGQGKLNQKGVTSGMIGKGVYSGRPKITNAYIFLEKSLEFI